jgi:hypothetical protein
MKQIVLGMVWNIDGHEMEVTKMYKNGKVQITETWISEDTWEECKHVANYIVATDENGIQYAYDPKYAEYANPGSSEYKWWARKYASGADFAPKQGKETTTNSKEDKEMCEIKRSFEVNGVTYMEAKTGYCYKSTGTFDKVGNPVMRRVGLSALEKAYEEYTALKKEEEDWGAEEQTAKTKAEAEKVQADKETENAFNKKHGVEILKSALEANKKYIEKSEKKTSKPRKSKDVAFEGAGITLTAKQVDFIKMMPNDDFYENGLDSTLWIDVFCDTVADKFSPMAVGAMVSTLKEKHLITVTVERVNGKKSKYMAFTETGKEVAKQLGLN